MKALYERGERLSKDIACIGLDRIEAFDIINNNFNYIERDGNQMGRHAMELLNDRVACPQKPLKQIVLTPVLRIHDL